MSGKLKMTEKIGDGDTTESDSPENSKSKKRSESSLGQVDPKNVKITVPSSKRDKTSLFDLSKHSHKTDSIPRKKSKTIPGPLFKAPKVTQEDYDLDKDNKVSSSVERTRQTYVRVSPHSLLDTPPKFDNKRDYKGGTHDETPDSSKKY